MTRIVARLGISSSAAHVPPYNTSYLQIDVEDSISLATVMVSFVVELDLFGINCACSTSDGRIFRIYR